jgi:hypothetical protein
MELRHRDFESSSHLFVSFPWVLSSRLRLDLLSLPFRLPSRHFVRSSQFPMHATSPSPRQPSYSWFDDSNNIWWWVQVMKPLIFAFMFLAPASRPALGPTHPPIHWAPGVKRGRGVTLTTHPHLMLRLRKNRSYTSSPSKRHLGV